MTKDRSEVDNGATDRVSFIGPNSSEARNFTRICGARNQPRALRCGRRIRRYNAVGVTR
jgi:hypothetical protein